MDWETVSHIATTAGSILAGLSLVAVFWLYRMNRRDEYIAKLREVITRNKGRTRKLDQMLLTHEITNEIAAAVVYSEEFALPFDDMLAQFFAKGTASKKQLEAYLEEYLQQITIPIHTPLLNQYEEVIEDLEAESAFLQIDYPGLFRVITSVSVLFQDIMRSNKELVRSEDTWKQLLVKIFEDEKRYDRIDKLKAATLHFFIGEADGRMQDSFRPNINDLLKMLDMATDAYLSLDGAALYALSRPQKRVELVPVSETQEISKSLLQAEKCLKLLFTPEQALDFGWLVNRFEVRNK